MLHWAARVVLLAGMVAVFALLALTGDAWAANGAYAVDAADISDLGSCKIESWLSVATNTDYAAVANPSCVVDLGKPVELTLQANRFRSDGDTGTILAPKAKFNIEPTGVGKWGYSFLTAAAFDASTGQNQNFLAEIPATYRFSEVTRINLNAGLFWDRMTNRQYFTYGAGFDWKLTNVWEFTIEVFGLAGRAPVDAPSTVRPRLQTGIQYRPNEIFSVDLIYGHNITGENASWITVGTTVRFPPPK
jgi:hypothetical protein